MATNYEHYKDSLIKLFASEKSACDFKRTNILEIDMNCPKSSNTGYSCTTCNEIFETWLNEEYKEPEKKCAVCGGELTHLHYDGDETSRKLWKDNYRTGELCNLFCCKECGLMYAKKDGDL